MSQRTAQALRVLAVLASGASTPLGGAWWIWSSQGRVVEPWRLLAGFLFSTLVAAVIVRWASGTWPWQNQLGTPAMDARGRAGDEAPAPGGRSDHRPLDEPRSR